MFHLMPPLNEHVDADHLDPPSVRKSATVIPPSHGAQLIVVDKLTQKPRRRETGEITEVDSGFGVASTSEDATISCTEGDHVARSCEV